MTSNQQSFLRRYTLNPFLLTSNELVMLKEIVQEQIDIRQEVRNKEVAVQLAEKVQEQSGKDQNLDILNLELRVARKKYAKELSEFDSGKPYEYGGYSSEHYLQPLPDRLQPITSDEAMEKIEEKVKEIKASDPSTVIRMVKTDMRRSDEDRTPIWRVEQAQEDGSWKFLGNQ